MGSTPKTSAPLLLPTPKPTSLPHCCQPFLILPALTSPSCGPAPSAPGVQDTPTVGGPGTPMGATPGPWCHRCGVRIILQPLDQSRQHMPKRPTAEHASGSRGVAEARPPHGAEHPSNGETQPGLSPQPLLVLGICRVRPLRMGWVSLLGDTAGMSQGGSAVPLLLGHPTPKPQNLHDPPSLQSELPQRVLHRGVTLPCPNICCPMGQGQKNAGVTSFCPESPTEASPAPFSFCSPEPHPKASALAWATG